ncbi:MAG: AI-2E family transporter [Burkholderiaceae bacterium]
MTSTSETPTPLAGEPPSVSHPEAAQAAETGNLPIGGLIAHRPIASIPLTILAVIAFVWALKWAQDFFIPLLFGILIAYTLNPVVSWIERRGLPRLIATSLVMIVLCGSAVLVANSVYRQAQSILDELPLAAYKLANAYKRIDDGGLGAMDKLRIATEALKQAANTEQTPTPSTEDTAASGEKPPEPPPVVVKAAEFDLNDWLWAGSVSAAAFIGQMTMVLFLVFFALVSGDTFKRKLVRLTGPSLSHKKITVHILEDINLSIQKYMLMLLVTNVMLGLLTWGLLEWQGLHNAGAWATAAALLHIIPYFGSLLATLAIALAAFLQFESFTMMFLAAGLTLGASTVIGMLVATWMTGRIARMNAMAVFVALLFGTWLWGVWGMLLCVPTVVVLKVISSRIEGLNPIAELLGE